MDEKKSERRKTIKSFLSDGYQITGAEVDTYDEPRGLIRVNLSDILLDFWGFVEKENEPGKGAVQKFISAIHPGEVLKKDFLEPYNITYEAVAKQMEVPHKRIYQILRGDRGIDGDTAIRLGLVFETSPEMWLRLQMRYELERAQEQGGGNLENEITPILK